MNHVETFSKYLNSKPRFDCDVGAERPGGPVGGRVQRHGPDGGAPGLHAPHAGAALPDAHRARGGHQGPQRQHERADPSLPQRPHLMGPAPYLSSRRRRTIHDARRSSQPQQPPCLPFQCLLGPFTPPNMPFCAYRACMSVACRVRLLHRLAGKVPGSPLIHN